MGSDGEIGLRIGTHDWFGVVNVGDAKGLCDRLEAARGEDDHYVVEEMAFSGSLFTGINTTGSPIRVLAGAKKFSEGWSSWRVTAMGLMNVGKKEGSEIIQLFGRGVRLRGFKFKLKRTSATLWLLWAVNAQGQVWLQKRPDTGIWAGLFSLPVFDSLDELQAAWTSGQETPYIAPWKHVLTHRDLHLHPVCLRGGAEKPPACPGQWVDAAVWPTLGLPAPIRALLVGPVLSGRPVPDGV
jgi:hypothetical protein